MAYRFIRGQSKPDHSVDFWAMKDEYPAVQEFYTEAFIAQDGVATFAILDNGRRVEVTCDFPSKSNYDAWCVARDSITGHAEAKAAAEEYCQQNGITLFYDVVGEIPDEESNIGSE